MPAATGLTLAFIGCGNMGGAVLIGLLNSLYPTAEATSPTTSSLFTKFIAVTKSTAGAANLAADLGRHASRVKILPGAPNQVAIEAADVVVLGCKPYFARDVLLAPGIQEALRGKLVVSMLAGMTVADIRAILFEGFTSTNYNVFVGKAVPNVAARYRLSMTILELSEPALPPAQAEILEWIFNQVGSTKYLAANLVNAGGMLVTNCLASLSVPIEGLLDGAVVGGLRRNDAMDLAVQGVYGLAAMLENKIHPAVMRESISSPRGSTIQSLLTVEKGATRAVFAQAQIDGTDHLKPAEEKRG